MKDNSLKREADNLVITTQITLDALTDKIEELEKKVEKAEKIVMIWAAEENATKEDLADRILDFYGL